MQPSGHLRITPACAGKTFSGYLYPTLSSDHPRVCGENDDEEDDEDLHLGSPPRVRGKPGGVLMASKEERITPACAGKTLSVLLALQGSSDPYGVLGARFGRITPACAGNTCCFCRSATCPADHPRVCGENDLSAHCERSGSGSPPRVRGKQGADGSGAGAGRITPACAGKTPPTLGIMTTNADHPRVCGEN